MSYKWNYSVITNCQENKSTVLCDLEGSNDKHLLYNVPAENLPYVLNTHEAASLNICNIWDDTVFNADERTRIPHVMETAKNTILF